MGCCSSPAEAASSLVGLREWREIGKLAAPRSTRSVTTGAPTCSTRSFAGALRPGGAEGGWRRGIPLVYEIRAFWGARSAIAPTAASSLKYRADPRAQPCRRRADAVVTICEACAGPYRPRHRPGLDHAGSVDLGLFGTPPAPRRGLCRA